MLDKTGFMRARYCDKALYLDQKAADALSAGDSADEEESRANQGNRVEMIAQKLFPEGVMVEGNMETACINTDLAVETGATTLFQATAMTRDLLARADILRKLDETTWELLEVKSAGEVGEHHIADAAFQKHVLEEAGYPIGKVSIVHVNKNFVRKGEVNPKKFLKITDVTKKVEAVMEDVQAEIKRILAMTAAAEPPRVYLGRHCKKPNACVHAGACWAQVPSYSVFDIRRIAETKLRVLQDKDILDIHAVPETFKLPKGQRYQVDRAREGTLKIDHEKIREKLGGLQYPIYFLDYEYDTPAIPHFPGTQSLQPVVFQYSVHVIAAPGAPLVEHSFLSRDKENPVPALLASMKEHIGEEGSVVVWSKTAEKTRNTEMARQYPEFGSFLRGINKRVFDLMTVFSEGLYDDPAIKGRWSLKPVFNHLFPEQSYDKLDVHQGDQATRVWKQMIFGSGNPEEKEKMHRDLLIYCGQDTIAMVRIWEYLKKIMEE